MGLKLTSRVEGLHAYLILAVLRDGFLNSLCWLVCAVSRHCLVEKTPTFVLVGGEEAVVGVLLEAEAAVIEQEAPGSAAWTAFET